MKADEPDSSISMARSVQCEWVANPHRGAAKPWLLRSRRLPMVMLAVLSGCVAPVHADDYLGVLIAVDIGHTQAAPGAISARGRSELSFNHDLALAVEAALRQLGMNTVLVNSDGQIASLAARPGSVPQADFFLSIHHDSVSEWELRNWEYDGAQHTYSDAWKGHSMFVSSRNPAVRLSTLCGSAMGARLQRTGFVPTTKNARKHAYADPLHAVHYYDNLVVLYRALQPALLFEAGVIKHRDEELLLRDPARQAHMADSIATGVAACMQVRNLP